MNSPSYDPQALQDRLAFVGIDDATRATLRDLQSTVAASIGSALDAFYRKAAQHPHTKRFFANAEHIASAKRRQESHWEVICEARFDESYVKAVSAVGCIHAKLGLEPRWYIGGYSLIVEKLIEDVVAKRWPSRFGSKGSQKLAREIGALVKAAMLDMDYGISVYLEAIENERRAAADAKAKADQERQQAIAAFGRALTKLRDGDLTARLDGDLGGDFAAMAADYNDAVASLEGAIGSVIGSIGSIRTGLGEITVAAGDLSQRTEQQAASLEETVAALSEVTRGINDTAASAAQAQQTAQTTQGTAEKGGSIVTEAVAAMGEIEASSNKIGSIISVIDEIAFQTNLLALNAGVEA
ncbi:MAG: globin-coupled sensor protein, partial [Methylobacterium mesophilicum]|nr:globin-coupled sensor protein [Methylobacterium mesophilicum]